MAAERVETRDKEGRLIVCKNVAGVEVRRRVRNAQHTECVCIDYPTPTAVQVATAQLAATRKCGRYDDAGNEIPQWHVEYKAELDRLMGVQPDGH